MKKFTKVLAVLLAVAVFATAFAACSKNGGTSSKVKVIDIALSDEEYAFGVDKNQPELKQQVNDFVAEIKSNGKLDEICNKYFADGTPEGITSATQDPSKDQLVVATNAEFAPLNISRAINSSALIWKSQIFLLKSLTKSL